MVGSSGLQFQVERLLRRAEECHYEVALAYYNSFAGLSERLDVTPVMARFPELYDHATYQQIAALTEAELPDERMRRTLRSVFADYLLHDRLKSVNEELANRESDGTLELDGNSVPYRSLPGLLGGEPDYDRRTEIDALLSSAVVELNPLRVELHARTRDLLAELGFNGVVDATQQLRGFDVPRLQQIGAQFMAASAAPYEDWLEQLAVGVGIPRRSLRFADMSYLQRGTRYDELFPPSETLPALSRTLAGLGIDLMAQKNIRLDMEPRPRKSPRAFCISIDAPRDVRLVLTPRGGQEDYAVLFHEAGHLQFSAHMDPALSYVYRQHGDVSVHESYAFLLQHVTCNPAWWHTVMRSDPGDYPRFARGIRLYMLRRYFSKLEYELEFYRRGADGNDTSLGELYRETLQRGTGVEYRPERYLYDLDPDLYVVQYLQAWIWEAQLRRRLVSDYGDAWFLNRCAGDFLRSLWDQGMKYNVGEIARQLGFDGLDPAPLLEDLLG